jgi:hypothetical protein
MYFSDSGIMLWGTVFMVWDILHLTDYLAIHRIDIHDCFLMNILIMGFISLISQFYDMLGLSKNSNLSFK